MGPLSELWKILHKYKKKGSGTFDLDTMLDLTLKSVLLVGQTQVAANFHRRLNVVASITEDKHKAEDLLKQNAPNWPAGPALFGLAFHKRLVNKAKTP